MKYISQLDYPDMPYITRTSLEGGQREKGLYTTVKTSGCGLCSALMVADRLLVNYDFDLEAAIQLSYEVKANTHVGTLYRKFAPAFAEKVGLELVMSGDPEQLRHCLRTGGAAVVWVGGDREDHVGLFSHFGHYIAVIGEEPDGRLAVLDPSYKEGKYEEEGRQGKVEMKNGIIALCSMDDLQADKKTPETLSYLFRRK